MDTAKTQLCADLTARKAALEQERQTFLDIAQGRLSELKRQMDEYSALANSTLAAKTAHIEELDGLLARLDQLEPPS